MVYFFWIITVLGITHIITGTKIFEKFRELVDGVSPNFWGVLVSCPTCMGFWVGCLVSSIFPFLQTYEIPFTFTNENAKIFLTIFLHGAFSSCLNWLTHLLTTIIESKTLTYDLRNEIIADDPISIAKQILND